MNKNHKGVTLLELLIVIAIVGIIAALGMPSYQRLIERNRLKEAVESFKSDVMLARTEAIKRSQNILINRTTGNAGTWCYGLSTKAACSCVQTSDAAADYCEIKRVPGADFSFTNMAAAAANNSTFNFRRGTIGSDGVTFTTTIYSARVVFNNVGRVRICTPSGATGLPDYPGC